MNENSSESSLSRVRTRQLAHAQRRPSLARLFSWTLIGNVIYAACQWGMLVVLAKGGTVHDVGLFSLALAITAPIFLMSNLQLRGILATDAERTTSIGSYVGLRLGMTMIAVAASIGTALLAPIDETTFIIVLLVTVSKAAESMSDIIYGWWQQHEKMDWCSLSLMMRGVLSLVVFGSFYQTTGSLTIALIGYATVWVLLLLVWDWPLACRLPQFGLTLQWHDWGKLIVVCWPMGAVMLLVSLQTNVPRYVIAHYFGSEAVGYFSALMYVLVVGSTVVIALGQSASPRIAQALASRERTSLIQLLRKLIAIVLVGSILLMLIGMMWGRGLLLFLYSADYAQYELLLLLLLVGATVGFIASIFGFVLTAARKFRSQLLISMLAVVTTWLVHIALIKLGLGQNSVAYALMAANVVQAVGCGSVVFNMLRHMEAPKGKIEHERGVYV
ncbi:lipopolysaccharide biosynthesis protein [Paenibacillus sp. 481]|uniref:lipopolysaccharide biosynthesis protein n=1 Tax=Paenibacillus sp. 481 TaxID=2835869 RepID=UPI001E63B251|nr:oligosaccharide flippase family protein [Paenibacillus sp. 481]UHA71962.1 oligosaccharide flippase family protein [Paenibacillus sp. 481]